MRLYLDADAIIYSVEGNPAFQGAVLQWVQTVEDAAGLLITSRISRLECRVRPLRESNQPALAVFEGFFSRDNLVLLDISSDVVEHATDLRARYRFRSPDAIHLATAILIGADVFLTGDADLARCSEIKVVTLSASPST